MVEQRRRFSRYPIAIPVQTKEKGEYLELETRNISRNGAFLRTDNPKAERMLIQLTFQTQEKTSIKVMATVTRSISAEAGPENCGMGIEFFSLSYEAKEAWEHFIDGLLPPASYSSPQAQPSSSLMYCLSKEQACVRRKTVRHIACFIVRMKSQKRLCEFYTRDISAGGMFLKSPIVKDKGQEVELIILHPETEDEFRISSTVIDSLTNVPIKKRGMRLQFSEMDDEKLLAFREFIQTGINYLNPKENPRTDRLQKLQKAVELAPRSSKTHTALGEALLEDLKGFGKSVIVFQEAIRLTPNYFPAYDGLKRAYEALGKFEKAAEVAIMLSRLEFHQEKCPAKPNRAVASPRPKRSLFS